MSATVGVRLRPSRGWAWGLLLPLSACGGGGGGAVALGEVVTVAELGASNPTAAVGEDGVFYVAWVGLASGAGAGPISDPAVGGGGGGLGGSGADVWLARSADGVRFEAPVRVNDVVGDAAAHEQAPAQVAAGAGGLVVVVWQNNMHEAGRRFPYSDVRLARSVDGGRTFAPAVTVNDDAGGPPSSHTFHDVAVGRGGEVVVSWIDSRERTRLEREVEGAKGAVGVDGAVAADGGMHGGHGAGSDSLPGPEIRIARSADGGVVFAPSIAIAADACPCCRTSLEVGRDGEVVVAWRGAEPGDVRDVVVARGGAGPDAAGFRAPTVVHADGWRIDGCPHAGPALALDRDGGLHVAWYTGAEGSEGLYYAVAGEDGVFGAPFSLVGGGWAPVSQVKIVAVPDGVILAWEDRRSEQRTISVGIAENGGNPRAFARGMPGSSPAIGAAGSRVGVAWLDGEAVRFAALR